MESNMADVAPEQDEANSDIVEAGPPPRGITEDWWAVILGGALLALTLAAVALWGATGDAEGPFQNPLSDFIGKPGSWTANPLTALVKDQKYAALIGTAVVFAASLVLFGIGRRAMGDSFGTFAAGFAGVFVLATLAYIMAGQETVKFYHLGYAMWAILLGLLVSNTIGTPEFLRPAVQTEFYIKTGLVLLGAEVLFGKLLELGKPGIFISWVVTPIVLVVTYWFGQRILRMSSRTLNITISADMSVCGVSAAIATASACRAKKEELTTAVGLSMMFTVIMMIVMPAFITAIGMDKIVGAAWMGGTIDATGAVAAAGAALGKEYLAVAATIKMIQNVLIGVIAFGVSVYWVAFVDRDPAAPKTSVWEIWRRFPKFILGFVGASILFSLIDQQVTGGDLMVKAATDGTTKVLRGWFFCLAFVSIGLDTNFRELAKSMQGGKPLVLYVCGQTLNLCLTLAMAWLMFKVVFPEAEAALLK